MLIIGITPFFIKPVSVISVQFEWSILMVNLKVILLELVIRIRCISLVFVPRNNQKFIAPHRT